MTREEMKQLSKDCRIANKTTVLWDSGGTVKEDIIRNGKKVTVRLSRGRTFVAAHEAPLLGFIEWNLLRATQMFNDSKREAYFAELGRRTRRSLCPFNPDAKQYRRCTCADGE